MATTKKRNPNVDARSAWGVFPHAERRVPTGRGYVVRAMESGYATDQHNYGGVVPVATFGKRGRAAAEQFAAKLTRERPTQNPRRGRLTSSPCARCGKPISAHTGDDLRCFSPCEHCGGTVVPGGGHDRLMCVDCGWAIPAPIQRENPRRGRARIPLVRDFVERDDVLTARDVNVTRLHNGALEVATVVRGHRESRVYYDYTRDEAIADFLAMVNRQSNPKREGFSERSAWEIAKHALEVIAAHAGETYPHFESPRGQRDISKVRQAIALSDRMLEQLERGIHRNPKGLGTGVTLTRAPGHRIMRKGRQNPPLAILGLAPNPPLVTFGDVTRIEYRHRHDGKDYFHNFKRPVQMRRTRAGKVVLSQRNRKPVVKLFEVPGK